MTFTCAVKLKGHPRPLCAVAPFTHPSRRSLASLPQMDLPTQTKYIKTQSRLMPTQTKHIKKQIRLMICPREAREPFYKSFIERHASLNVKVERRDARD